MDRVWLCCLFCLMTAPVSAESVALVDASGFAPFQQLDSDRNAYVSRVEARIAVGLHEMFDSADANHDGLLNRSEYASARLLVEVR